MISYAEKTEKIPKEELEGVGLFMLKLISMPLNLNLI